MFTLKSRVIMRNLVEISLSVFLIFLFTGCQKSDSTDMSTDQKKILDLYASTYLMNEYQYLYFKSENKNQLQRVLKPPLESEDFKLSRLAVSPEMNQEHIDSLFTEDELLSWANRINNYEQLEWEQNWFFDEVKILNEQEVPDYLNRSDIPPPGQEPVFIHYITPPFVYADSSALLYTRKWSSGANVKSYFYYYVKVYEEWKLVFEGALSVGY